MVDEKEKVTSPEAAPRLKAIEVKAGTVEEAMAKAQGGAGSDEFEWVYNNPADAAKMLTGGERYYFPNAYPGSEVPWADFYRGKVGRHSHPLGYSWLAGDRVVVFD